MFSGVIDIIPDDQEIVHIAHIPDHLQLIGKPLRQSLPSSGVARLQSLLAEMIQIGPGVEPFRHFVLRQFCHAEFDLHAASVRDPLGIFHRLPGIGKQSLHLLLALDIILPALIAHSVLIGEFLSGLKTEQDVVGFYILRVGVMHVVRTDQRNLQFPGHIYQSRVHRGLRRNAVVLQFQKIVALAEALLIFQRRLLCLLHHSLLDIAGHFPRKAGGERDDPLVELPQNLHIHPGSVVVPLRMAAAHDLHQVLIPFIVLRQVISLSNLEFGATYTSQPRIGLIPSSLQAR